ncbi:protein obstructor-E-like [Ornithodoros turicata]|uniref:protein obstructor-E-like n=1 Tax=Ornithodoros turicata TaxID=34597 RepID=UPI0031391B53
MFRALLALLALIAVGHSQCPQGDGYFPHESYCDAYYQCKNGTVQVGTCPDGLLFNVDLGHKYLHCDQFGVNCEGRPYQQEAQGQGNCPRRWGMYTHPTDCGKFITCVDGKSFDFNCPEGLAYNQERGVCDWPDLVERCDAEAFLNFRCPEPSQYELQDFVNPPYAHPSDCAKHYVCVATFYGKRLPRLLSCDYGNVFNPNTRACDEPINVPGCENYYGAPEEPQDRRQSLRQRTG